MHEICQRLSTKRRLSHGTSPHGDPPRGAGRGPGEAPGGFGLASHRRRGWSLRGRGGTPGRQGEGGTPGRLGGGTPPNASRGPRDAASRHLGAKVSLLSLPGPPPSQGRWRVSDPRVRWSPTALFFSSNRRDREGQGGYMSEKPHPAGLRVRPSLLSLLCGGGQDDPGSLPDSPRAGGCG